MTKQMSDLQSSILRLGACINKSGSGGTSDATEATLLAILAELRDNNSLNEMLVTDTAEVIHIRRTTVNADTGAITTQYLNPQTQAVSVPTFPIVASSTDDWELLEVELLDDTLKNGSGPIIQYSELYAVAVNGTRTLIATVDQKGANYTLVGTRRSANEIGVNTKTSANQLILDGATWTPTIMTAVFSYVVVSVANPLTPPTYTGSNNVAVPLFESESGKFEVLGGTNSFDNTDILITAQAGDTIKILYSEITI